MKNNEELEMNYINTHADNPNLELNKNHSENFMYNNYNELEGNFKEKSRSNSSEGRNKLQLIVKETIEIRKNFSPLSKENTSVWKKIRNKVSNFKNNIKYNTLT